MRFVKLRCENFGSFKELDYDFVQKPILIQGENTSEDSQESNGSGKSFIQAAIEFCLFKTTSRKVKDIELINFDSSECFVELTISCEIRRQVLKIYRQIKKKGSTNLQLFINDEPVEFANINDGNKFIVEWIGIQSEDLQNYYIINKERFRSIFSSSNREKIDIINRFSRSSIISGIDKLVQRDIQREESLLTDLLKSEISIQSKITTLKEQLDYEVNRNFEEEQNQKILVEKGEIDKLVSLISLNNTKISENLNDVRTKEELKSILEQIESIEFNLKNLGEFDDSNKNEIIVSKNNLYDKIKSCNSERIVSKNSLREVDSLISDIEKVIKGSVTCPKCSHVFNISDPNIDIEEEKKTLSESLKVSNQIIEKLSLIEDQVKKYEFEINKLDDNIRSIESQSEKFYRDKKLLNTRISLLLDEQRKVESQLKKNQDEISLLSDDINIKKNKIKIHEDNIEAIKNQEKDTVRIESIKESIKVCKVELKSIEEKVETQKSKIFEVSQWIVNFKKFNVHLANKSLLAIQANCNKFLKDIKSDIQVRWEGYKIMSDKSIKEEITPYVIRDNETRDFWSFSGGERVRMEYAMIFTLQKMINSTNKWGGLSFLSTDEIGEGLDSLGLSDLMKSFESLNKTVLITTHVVNRSISENVLLIRKENKVSKIVKI